MTDRASLQDLVARRIATRLVARDSLIYAPPEVADVHASVRNRLGWLDAPRAMTARVEEVARVVRAAASDGLTDVYLLGMGGSSLCAEVLRDVPGPRRASARLAVLDTTDERAVSDVTRSLVPDRSLFLVASKSGSTIEVTSLERHFWTVMHATTGERTGAHFVAITDPGTSLVAQARAERYRHTFVNPSDIGGRYSALSLFGLVPAALLGIDIEGLLASAARLATHCAHDDVANPGLALGAFMGNQAAAGRDKLTLIAAPPLAPIAAWIEQLVAESTGKLGTGILPIADEPPAPPAKYGSDRAFVAIVTREDRETRERAHALEAAGHPVFIIETEPADLGAEFYRWEFATAVAGHVLGVNPFDEPNVRDAKVRTQQQLDVRAKSGAFTLDPPLVPVGSGIARRQHGDIPSTHAGRYVALLDYLPQDAARGGAVARIRETIRHRTGAATTYGVGPRYLHSTGQYHKGGPNTGTFVLLTGADRTATAVPGAGYTFSVLKQAQALGDFEALVAAGRHVVHYHLDDSTADLPRVFERVVSDLT
ncbi:MAG: glucose-6-phosphate isomerase [Acidobacteria bacterium]|nr:glucose-6-phosphate isomerase [Acidobacteriota bacterium]